MTQNVLDYSQNPNGNELMDTYLAGMAQNQLTNHSGVTRPSYAVAGTFWIDISTTPWTLKQFNGTSDVVLGTLNQTSLYFTAQRALGDKNGNDITSTYLGKNATAVKATGDKNGNDITTTYLTVTGTAAKATADADGNTIKTTYAKIAANNTFSGTNTFTAVPVVKRSAYTGLYNRRSDLEYNVTPASNTTMGGIEVQDKNNIWVGRLAVDMSSGGVHTTYLSVRGEDNSINSLAIKRNASGSAWVEFPTPSSATDNSDRGATTKWVRNHRCTTAATTTSSASVDAPAYIVQNYKNGKSWYYVWSDGWIEQGGYKSSGGNVTLLKTMSDTDFSLQVTADDTSSSSIDCSGKINSVTEIKLNIPGGSQGAWWRVSGY